MTQPVFLPWRSVAAVIAIVGLVTLSACEEGGPDAEIVKKLDAARKSKGRVFPWYFISSLRFSAERALLLAILLLTHWLSALTQTPALLVVFRPKFAQQEGALVEEERPPHVALRVQTTH